MRGTAHTAQRQGLAGAWPTSAIAAAGSSSARSSAVRTSCLQSGQLGAPDCRRSRPMSHRSMHAAWNLWEHGSSRNWSPAAKVQRHTGHSFSPLAAASGGALSVAAACLRPPPCLGGGALWGPGA